MSLDHDSDPQSARPRLVVIGGGGGVSQVLLGARGLFGTLSGIIAVTDTGRSTGVARKIGAMPAPGDLRNTLAALAADPQALPVRLAQHRLSAPDLPALDGMAFGNLLIAALTQLLGDFDAAVAEVGRMLGCVARVLPASTVDAELCAELDDGRLVYGEVAVRALPKPPIRRLLLRPDGAAANPAALQAIAEADLVALGPGSFFTSVMASLQFAGMREALHTTAARIVFVANTTTQPGQTDGMSLVDHVRWLVEWLGPGGLDAVLISKTEAIPPALEAAYQEDGLQLLRCGPTELDQLAAMGVTALVRDLAEITTAKRQLWQKQDSIRHAPALVAQALREVVG